MADFHSAEFRSGQHFTHFSFSLFHFIMFKHNTQSAKKEKIYRVSQKKRPAFESLLVPEYISDDILQNLIR